METRGGADGGCKQPGGCTPTLFSPVIQNKSFKLWEPFQELLEVAPPNLTLQLWGYGGVGGTQLTKYHWLGRGLTVRGGLGKEEPRAS